MANQEYINLKDVITKVEVKLDVETNLIIGIKTLLDIVSITSRDSSRGTFSGKLSKRQYASATLPLNKGKRLQA